MGANQQAALEAILSTWKTDRAVGLPASINAFEYFCLEHYSRDWIDSDEELQSGLVGGSGDGGVDAMYFFVNRELVTETSLPIDPKTVLKTTLLLFQVKEGDGFSPFALDKLAKFADDLLDLTKKEAQYHST